MRLIPGYVRLLPFLWFVSSARAAEMPRLELPELSPNEARYAAEFERGAGLYRERKFEEALVVFAAIEAKAPECAAAQFCVGATLGATGRYDDAAAKLTKVIEAHPGYPVCFAYRAWVYMLQEKWESALPDLDVCLKLRGGNRWCLLARGWCRLESSNIHETLNKYWEEHAGDTKALENYRVENASVEAALKDFDSVLELTMGDTDALIGKALGLAMKGDRKGARDALWDLDDGEERSPRIAEREVRVYQYLRDAEGATVRARALVERDPTNINSWSLLARASSRLQEVSEEAVHRNPLNPGAHLWRGMCVAYVDLDMAHEEILKTRELDRAGFGARLDWLQQEAAREPFSGIAGYRLRLLLAVAISGTGDPARARAYLEREEFRLCLDRELIWVRMRIDADEGKFNEAVARLDENFDKIPRILERTRLIETLPSLHGLAKSQEYRDWKFPQGQK
ncbi:MAG: TPR repeat-containing [Planctomycetota bacterium]|nr:MAG: TPR repeat-containing [Planctomycetota bacterium]